MPSEVYDVGPVDEIKTVIGGVEVTFASTAGEVSTADPTYQSFLEGIGFEGSAPSGAAQARRGSVKATATAKDTKEE